VCRRYPTGFLQATEIILCSIQGECWTVNSFPESEGRALHTSYGGWIAFVRDNNYQDRGIIHVENQHPMITSCSSVSQ